MKKIGIATLAALVLLAGSAFAYMGGYGNQYTKPFGYGSQYARPFGDRGYGMMGSSYGMGGMMGYGLGSRGYSGYGCSGHGYGYDYGTATNPLTSEEARGSVQKYLSATGNADLKLAEVMEFDNHFYAEVEEKSTGIHAFELLVDRYTGAITPEMGPNMMWNTKYGHMAWLEPAQATVTKEQAAQYAQRFLDTALPGTKADEADAFYGYYTIHVLKDSKIYGMLSVNAYTGAVWYHSWHGKFINILKAE